MGPAESDQIQKRPLGITLTGGFSIFFGVLLVINLISQWNKILGQYTFLMVIVYLLFGGSLIAAGVGILKTRNWGRWLLMGVCGILLFLLAISIASSASKPHAFDALTILILLWPLSLFLTPIIYLTRPKVREYFGIEE